MYIYNSFSLYALIVIKINSNLSSFWENLSTKIEHFDCLIWINLIKAFDWIQNCCRIIADFEFGVEFARIAVFEIFKANLTFGNLGLQKRAFALRLNFKQRVFFQSLRIIARLKRHRFIFIAFKPKNEFKSLQFIK